MNNKIKAYVIVLALLASSCSLWESGEEEEPPSIPGKLVFAALDDSQHYQLYTSLTNGTKLKKLTNFKNDDAFNPSWSNDGKQIAFSTTLNATTSGPSLYLMNSDGSNLRPLKKRPNTDVPTAGNNPAWSPDDSKIAFDFCDNCERGGNNYDIYVYDFNSTQIVQLFGEGFSDSNPKWLNNNIFYFITDRDYYLSDSLRNQEEVYAIDITENLISRITDTGKIGSFTFNKNNNSILIRPEHGSDNWYFLDITTNDSTFFEFPVRIPNLFTSAVKWSGNGKWLLLRVGNGQGSALFKFYNFETEVIYEINDKPLNYRGIDWFDN